MIKGVEYVVDDRGEPTAVVIDLKEHRELWEDFYDRALAEARRGEPRESLASVKAKLSARRRRRPVPDYTVGFTRSARRELERLPLSTARRVLAAVERLARDPRPVGVRKLHGTDDLWRLAKPPEKPVQSSMRLQ